jgi:aldehyde:ferredoxin oxidoreductase
MAVAARRAGLSDPLAPSSPLIFAFSPLVGSPLTTTAKFAVVSKSPLTDRFNDALAGSGFAIAGKHSGADAIVIVGRAPELSVLVVDNGDVRIEPAHDLAGCRACARKKHCASARRLIQNRVDRSCR